VAVRYLRSIYPFWSGRQGFLPPRLVRNWLAQRRVCGRDGAGEYNRGLHMIVVWPRVSARNAGRLWSTLPFPRGLAR
jgi:hypothetical protein